MFCCIAPYIRPVTFVFSIKFWVLEGACSMLDEASLDISQKLVEIDPTNTQQLGAQDIDEQLKT